MTQPDLSSNDSTPLVRDLTAQVTQLPYYVLMPEAPILTTQATTPNAYIHWMSLVRHKLQAMPAATDKQFRTTYMAAHCRGTPVDVTNSRGDPRGGSVYPCGDVVTVFEALDTLFHMQ